jgi:hypothetical protein
MNPNDNIPNPEHEETEEVTQEQVLEAMFSNLVIQQTRTALFSMGQIADPETGQRILDLEGAQMLIATLEMLKEKTRGNLSVKEDKLISQSINQLHDIFEHTVRAVEKAQAEKGSFTESGLYTPPSGIITPSDSLSTAAPSHPNRNPRRPLLRIHPSPSLNPNLRTIPGKNSIKNIN